MVTNINVLWKKKYGISQVEIITPTPFPKDEQNHLTDLIKGADMQMKVDPTLIGGTIIRVDDRLIDASVRGRLERMKQMMMTNNHYV